MKRWIIKMSFNRRLKKTNTFLNKLTDHDYWNRMFSNTLETIQLAFSMKTATNDDFALIFWLRIQARYLNLLNHKNSSEHDYLIFPNTWIIFNSYRNFICQFKKAFDFFMNVTIYCLFNSLCVWLELSEIFGYLFRFE